MEVNLSNLPFEILVILGVIPIIVLVKMADVKFSVVSKIKTTNRDCKARKYANSLQPTSILKSSES
jgi:hypothetical protein